MILLASMVLEEQVSCRLLQVAASLAAGRPADLREAVRGLGTEHARRLIEAVAIATGVAGLHTISPAAGLGELRARGRTACLAVAGERAGHPR